MIDKEYLKRVTDGQIDDGAAHALIPLLWIASFFYWCSITLRNGLYFFGLISSHRFKEKVISVGNLTVGGTGKTPLVQCIVDKLTKESKASVILTRGYMSNKDSQSDEAELLRVNLPKTEVLVGKKRSEIAREYLLKGKTDFFVLDDGFQHLKIQRDLDILVIDSTNPWGNGFLLPRGILRERLPALKRAHIVVLTRTDLGVANLAPIYQKIKEYNRDCLVVESVHQPKELVDVQTDKKLGLKILKDKYICALSAIGAPDSFENALRNLGAVMEESYRFIDHHVFTKEDILNIIRFCKSHRIEMIVLTQKDAVKIKDILAEIKPDIQFVYLSIEIKITKKEEEFVERIHTLLSH